MRKFLLKNQKHAHIHNLLLSFSAGTLQSPCCKRS